MSQGSAPLLITELAHPQHRGKLTTMYNTLWYVGAIIAAWTVFGTIKYTSEASWRIPVGMQAAMPVIQFIGIWFLPESPRWLCSKDRSEEALEILIKVSLRTSPLRAVSILLTYTHSTTQTATETTVSANSSSTRSKKQSVWRKKTPRMDGQC